MLFDYETLKIIWWLLVGALLIGFAIMDGHDMVCVRYCLLSAKMMKSAG